MQMIKLSLAILFHPIDSFGYIKSDRNKFSYVPAIVLLLALIVVRIGSIFAVHFPLASIQPEDANIWLEIVRFILPLLSWVIACYAVTTILDGESLLRETLTAAAYAMLPYIVFMLPIALLSHAMDANDSGLYSNLNNIIWIWVMILFFISVKTLNGYDFTKTVIICILSILTMLIVWAIATLFLAMTGRLYEFILSIIMEIKMMFI